MLVTSVMLCLVLGVTIGTYLLIAQYEFVGASYSHSWHKTLTMAEAGVEEALVQINGAGISGTGPALPSANTFHREFDNASYDVQVISGPGASATIYSTGYVTIPKLTNVITRVLVVKTTNAPLFGASVAALTNIAMTSSVKGANFSDSIDSANPKSGTSSQGLVACLGGTVNIGSSTILGDLLLGPTASAPSTRPKGTVFHDLNTDLPDVIAPPLTWLPATFAYESIDRVIYTYVFTSSAQGQYTINKDGAIYVGPDANVSLQIQSPKFTASSIYIAGTNQHAGKLALYALQPSVTIGDVTVESGKAANFLYLGTSQNTSLVLNNDFNFVGSIYAPSAKLTYNASSSGKTKKVTSFTGSCIANSVQINGAASFHFDKDLLRNSPMTRGYVVTSWKEL